MTRPTGRFPYDELGADPEDAVRDTARRILNDVHRKPLISTITYGDNAFLLPTQVAATFKGTLETYGDTIRMHYDGSSHVQIDCRAPADVPAHGTN